MLIDLKKRETVSLCAVAVMAAALLTPGCGRDTSQTDPRDVGLDCPPPAVTNAAALEREAHAALLNLTHQLQQDDEECQRLMAQSTLWRQEIGNHEAALQARLAEDPEWVRLRAALAAAQREGDQRQQQRATALRQQSLQRLGVTQQVATIKSAVAITNVPPPAATDAESQLSLAELHRAFYEASQRLRSEDELCRGLVATNEVLRQAIAANDQMVKERLEANAEWRELQEAWQSSARNHRKARQAAPPLLLKPAARPSFPPTTPELD